MATPKQLEGFFRVVTDSKYQFSLGLLATMFTVFPADWKLLVCVTAIGTATIVAEGFRDYARNRDGAAVAQRGATPIAATAMLDPLANPEESNHETPNDGPAMRRY